MKRVLLSALVLGLVSLGPVYGQGSPPGAALAAKGGDGERMRQMVERLGLTPKQKDVAGPIIKAGIAERLAILEKHGIKKGQRPGLLKLRAVRSDLEASRARTKAQLANILSPAQMTEYQKLTEEFRAEMRKTYAK